MMSEGFRVQISAFLDSEFVLFNSTPVLSPLNLVFLSVCSVYSVVPAFGLVFVRVFRVFRGRLSEAVGRHKDGFRLHLHDDRE